MIYGQKQLSSNIADNNFFFELKPIKAWRAIFGLALAISISLLIGGPIAIATFPLGSLTLGWFLYRRYPLFYCSFTWWMWFVGPVIRRIIDLRCGYLTPGPWHVTPQLVTAISLLSLFKHLPKAYKQGGLPFIIPAAGCIYGYLLSLIDDGLSDQILVVFLGWIVPISFGFHLFIHWREYPSYRQNLQRTFLWGVLFMGLYGIVQYVFAPPWDCFFLVEQMNQGASQQGSTFGFPEPFGIRVFSSAMSPQDFATMMGAGLILLFCIRGSQQLLASGLGYLSFLLSLARSGWLSWIVSILIFFRALKFNLQIRMAIGIILTALIILPVTTIEPFSTVIGDRITSLSNTDSDYSLRQRLNGFSVLRDYAMSQFFGLGLENPIKLDIKGRDNLAIGDNGLLVLLFGMGWLGTLPYLLSMLILVFQIRQVCLRNSDLLLQATYAIILGILPQLFFKNILVNSMGMILWGFIGIGMSGCNYSMYRTKIANIVKTHNVSNLDR